MIKENEKGAEAPTAQGKDKYLNQLKQAQIAFFEYPKTMKMVAKQINCDRANVCRYKATMSKSGAIWLISKGVCPITRHAGVGFYSTNPSYAESLPVQSKLF